ncbi:MAG TPA: hypothetical protein VFO65_02305, partial [Acidimicrobiales bacterium]|nr:hypothetical protein [Acidimicrobiales bacterium]
RLQSRSSGGRRATAVRTVVAGEQRGGGGVASAGRRVAGTVTGEGARQRVLITLGLGLVLLVGSRQLLSGRLPAVGQLAPFPDGPGAFLRLFASGWRSSGLGSEAPAPFAFALLGVGGVVALGAMDLLQKVLVLGMIPLGVIGAHRLAAPIGSWRGRALSAVLYAAVPLPYDALAAGRWAGLVAYGVAPWLLSRLLRATGLEPFGAPARPELLYRRRREDSGGREGLREGIDEVLGAEAATLDAVSTEELRVAAAAMVGRRDEPDGRTDRRRPVIAPAVLLGRPPGPLPRQAMAAALLVAVAAAFAPALAAVTVLVGLGLVLSSALAGGIRAMVRALGVAGGAVLGAGLLLMPWTLELVLPGAGWAGFTGLGRPASAAPGLAEILRFGTGPVGSSPLNWGLILVAGLPLAVGRRWRFSWSTRLWVVALVCWGVAWAAGRGWLGIPPPPVDVLLAPAAAALVLCAALGQAAYERDLSRFRFGLRQLGFVGAALAAVSTTLPVVAAALDGRWNLPRRDLATLVSWMPERRSEGSFRVLWAGEPGALPLDGWALDGGLAYGTSRGGAPGATDLWPASDSGATGLLADSLAVARRGETTTLGHLLGPLGVRFVAVPSTAAPGEDDPPSRSPGLLDLLAAMRSQTDLKLVQSDPAIVVYENAAWAPAVSVLGDQAAAASEGSGLDVARTTDLRGSRPALVERGLTRHTGEVVPGPVYLAEAHSERWALTVGSEEAEQRKAFGWASLFSVREGGKATLRYRTSPVRWLAILVELVLWLAVVVAVARGRRDGARAPAEDSPPARPLAAPAVTAGSWGRP